MNTKWKRLAAILWIGSAVLATWIWVYAAQNKPPLNEFIAKGRHQMMTWGFWPEEMRNLLPEKWDLTLFEKWKIWNKRNEWKWNRFWFAFIDEDSLTDEQKEEIQRLQEERDKAIEKINNEFFDKLEKYISEEKLEDYENFVENREHIQ